MDTCMVLPDLQVPYHDKGFVKKLLAVAEEHQPDLIVGIGDWMDFPEVSRWTKGLAGEYADTLQSSIDQGRALWCAFRDVCPDARLVWKTGNHDERIEEFVYRYAPPLRNLRSARLEGLFDLEPIQVEVHRHPLPVFGGRVLVMHGHEEAYSSVPGKWGLEQVKKQGVSVVYGHTHTPFLSTHTVGSGRKAKSFFAMNVGHGCDPGQMHYAKSGYFNWCRAFGMIHVDRGKVYPELVTALDGTFRLNGNLY
jgi:predicted phosphodiesterase